jgi:hypothetical protein
MMGRADRILHLVADSATAMVFRSAKGRLAWPMVLAALICSFIAYTYGAELRPRPRLFSTLLSASAVLLFLFGISRLLAFRELRLETASGALLFTRQTLSRTRTRRFAREQIKAMELRRAPRYTGHTPRYVVTLGTHSGEVFLLADHPLGIHGRGRALEFAARLERLLLRPLTLQDETEGA